MRHPDLYLRSLVPDDVPAVVSLLDDGLAGDVVDATWVRDKTFHDPDYDPDLSLVALDGGRIAGFAQGVTRAMSPGTAWVKWFATTASDRRKGVMSALFDRLEWIARVRGAVRMRIADCPPNFAFPGVDHRYGGASAFLSARGYAPDGEVANMTCDLRASDWSTGGDERALMDTGVSIRRAERSDMQAVFDFARTHFPGWVPELAACFLRRPVSIHLAFDSGEMVAFAAYDGNNPGRGWFGPMGTASLHRKRGIGGVLLRRCLHDLLAQGHCYATIPWVGPVDFYARMCGAVVDRTFQQFEKKLPDSGD